MLYFRHIMKSLVLLAFFSLQSSFGSPILSSYEQDFSLSLEIFNNLNNQNDFCTGHGFFKTHYVDHDLREVGLGNKDSIQKYLQLACGEKHPNNSARYLNSSPQSEFNKTFNDMRLIANCFKLPVEIFYAIWIQETGCGLNALSANGVGPFQLTTAGMTEVNDQIGVVPNRTLESAKVYFQEAFQCVEKSNALKDPIKKDRKQFNSKLKESAVYTATLLKVFYSVELTQGGCQASAFSESINSQPNNNCWKKILQRYNGHPKYKVNYSKNVAKYYKDMLKGKSFKGEP
jgi:hypothetical protein